MADSLDDFFAKKDKKKGKDKGKTAALSAEALVKELEEGAKQAEYAPRKDAKPSATLELLGLDANDADWKDFEEVEKRDYTGLKVKEMSIQDQDEEQRRMASELVEPVPDIPAWRKDKEVATVAEPEPLSSLPVATQTPSNQDPASSPSDPIPASDTAEVKTANPEDGPSTDLPNTDKPGEQDRAVKLSSDEKKSDVTSAKKKYVPPFMKNLVQDGESSNFMRTPGDVKVLEPVRMSKLKGPATRGNSSVPDILDERSFPSLG